MFSTKQNVLQTVALLKAHGIDHIVISPGSRNAPLAHCFNQDPFFRCFSIVDERSAGYFAIGMMDKLQRPVALCCTSGSAILNYGPAVAEAYYRELPLVVISADRTPSWIGQMDGQTIPQQGAYGNLVRKSVQLPEIHSEEDLWYCNRLINEALIECNRNAAGPVHINIPISEPLFNFTEEALPKVRQIQSFSGKKLANMSDFSQRWNASEKTIILVGQMPVNKALTALLENLAAKEDCVVLCEHLANSSSPHFIGNFDTLLTSVPDVDALIPDLLITLGGHVVSKKIKTLFRQHPPKHHWQIAPSGVCVDTFQCLTDLIETDALSFFSELEIMGFKNRSSKNNEFVHCWKNASSEVQLPDKDLNFSDITVVGAFLKVLPSHSSLFVGNSSSVRNIQFFPLPDGVSVFCNRGTNGIEGSISTASGYAALHEGLTFLVVGDLSFFYDLNGLWNKYFSGNLRILLINNGGGGIFHLLPGLEQSNALNPFIAAQHDFTAEKWIYAAGFDYLKASNETELHQTLPAFVASESLKPIVLELFTSVEVNKSVSNLYYQKLKKNRNDVNR